MEGGILGDFVGGSKKARYAEERPTKMVIVHEFEPRRLGKTCPRKRRELLARIRKRSSFHYRGMGGTSITADEEIVQFEVAIEKGGGKGETESPSVSSKRDQ